MSQEIELRKRSSWFLISRFIIIRTVIAIFPFSLQLYLEITGKQANSCFGNRLSSRPPFQEITMSKCHCTKKRESHGVELNHAGKQELQKK